jgi:hypothetical protein
MPKAAGETAVEPYAELFSHGADIGVRGVGPTCAMRAAISCALANR